MLLGHAGKQGTSAEEVGGASGDEHVVFSALWRVVLAASPVAFAAMVSLCAAQDEQSHWIATVAPLLAKMQHEYWRYSPPAGTYTP